MTFWDLVEMGICVCGGQLENGRCNKCGLKVVVYEAD